MLNPIFGVKEMGSIGGKKANNWGLSGLMLGASEIQWNVHEIDNYGVTMNLIGKSNGKKEIH